MNSAQRKIAIQNIAATGLSLGASLHPGAVRTRMIDMRERCDRFLDAVHTEPEPTGSLPIPREKIPKSIREHCSKIRGHAPRAKVINEIRLIRSLADEWLQS